MPDQDPQASEALPRPNEAVSDHDQAPGQGDGAEEAPGAEFPGEKGAEGLEDGVGDEEGGDDDGVSRADLELEVGVQSCDGGRGDVDAVHERYHVESGQDGDEPQVAIGFVRADEAAVRDACLHAPDDAPLLLERVDLVVVDMVMLDRGACGSLEVVEVVELARLVKHVL